MDSQDIGPESSAAVETATTMTVRQDTEVHPSVSELKEEANAQQSHKASRVLKMPAAFRALSNENQQTLRTSTSVPDLNKSNSPRAERSDRFQDSNKMKAPSNRSNSTRASPVNDSTHGEDVEDNASFSSVDDVDEQLPSSAQNGNASASDMIGSTDHEQTAENGEAVDERGENDDFRRSIEQSRRSATAVRDSMDLRTTTKRSSSRDRYGFRKKSNYITEAEYDAWWEGYEPYLKRRKRKWMTLMKDSGLYLSDEEAPVRFPPKSEKLKRYVRKGIPAEWRGNAWFWFAKGHEQLASHKGLYDKLCRQTQNLKNNDTELIERDLQRTFPDNIYFRSPEDPDEETVLIQALRRVLTCFSVYMPKIGYCQSLNFLAGMLLLFLDEEKTFWMLVIITQRYLPGVHEVNLEGVSIDQGVLVLCVKEALPSLWDKLGVNFEGQHDVNVLSNLPPITLCTTPWFMSGYIGVLPVESVLRVWDSFFFEDSKIFFRIALTILKMSEPIIHNMNDQMEVFQTIQNLPKKLIDCSSLLEQCFKRRNGFGHISQAEITRLRAFVHERRQKHLREQTRTAAAESRSIAEGSNRRRTVSGKSKPSKELTDLEEFKKLKPGIGKRGLHLSQRMKSLRKKDRTPAEI